MNKIKFSSVIFFALINSVCLAQPEVQVAANGLFLPPTRYQEAKAVSENGKYYCSYQVGRVRDEFRELLNFKLNHNDRTLYTLSIAPGSDMYISNTGSVAFIDFSRQFQQKVTIHLYSAGGQEISSQTFTNPFSFKFSVSGKLFGVATPAGFNVISLEGRKNLIFPRAYDFDFSDDDNWLTTVDYGTLRIYDRGKLVKELETGFDHVRKVRISEPVQIVAVMARNQLKVYSLSGIQLLYIVEIDGNQSFRDLAIKDDFIVTGIQEKTRHYSNGILTVFNRKGEIVLDKEMAQKKIPQVVKSMQKSYYNERLPWPIAPFNEVKTVWNYYEQHMGLGIDSYLHQGLDIITPIAEPCFAAADGYVKCVLTIGGSYYWRVAISPQQSDSLANGLLYAHLIESSIFVDVGDTVRQFDYIGDIIEWAYDWGHLHFAEIKDSGAVWFYDDNEWGITRNPLLFLTPHKDEHPPYFSDVFPGHRFAFVSNMTDDYLEPNFLFGAIDIIAHITDYIGTSRWQQPAFKTYYWVKSINEDTIVFPRTLGQILNHEYDFYQSDYYIPYAPLIYKRDEQLIPPSWMDKTRAYYHILTNNNGDTLVDLSEDTLAFSTTDFNDGPYRIFVEAFDEYGNRALDSMEVQFVNGITRARSNPVSAVGSWKLWQNYPNPFNARTIIEYNLSKSAFVQMNIYDLAGKLVRQLVNEKQTPGMRQAVWDGTNESNEPVASGIYFYRLTSGEFSLVSRLILLR